MKRVGRNDPCPCGSGKKYKQCHGASNIIEFHPNRYDDECHQLHEDLVNFAWAEFEMELADVIERSSDWFLGADPQLMEHYVAMVVAWKILHEPLADGKTIFDHYNQKNDRRIKFDRVQKAFKSWKESIPSFYEVVEQDGEKVYLRDMRTHKTYTILAKHSKYKEGSILIGILIPYVQHHDFFFNMIGINDVDEWMLREFPLYKDHELIADFPEILAHVLELSDDDLDGVITWADPQYEQVAEVLMSHMFEKGAPEIILSAGILIWKSYTEDHMPRVRKPEAYAAALEYIVQKYMLERGAQTQQALAAEYGTNPATISNHTRRIIEALGDELFHILEVFADMEGIDDEPEIDIDRLAMEKNMHELFSALETFAFDSEEEKEAFLRDFAQQQQMMVSAPETRRDMAQDKLYEAFQVHGAARKRLIEEALEIYPNSPDAYVLMAEDVKNINEKYQLLTKAVYVGKKDLGKDFIKEHKGHFWMLLETRPYMRALIALAHVQYELGDTTSAIETLEEMLVLNPGDNQGVRYQLLTLYLETKQYDQAQELIKQYDEGTAIFHFNDALCHFFTDGLTSKTKARLKTAHQANPFVRDYLTGKKPIPKEEPEYFGFGDDREAIIYVQENGHLWKDAKPLVEALAKMK